jgi:hypothetical protein
MLDLTVSSLYHVDASTRHVLSAVLQLLWTELLSDHTAAVAAEAERTGTAEQHESKIEQAPAMPLRASTKGQPDEPESEGEKNARSQQDTAAINAFNELIGRLNAAATSESVGPSFRHFNIWPLHFSFQHPVFILLPHNRSPSSSEKKSFSVAVNAFTSTYASLVLGDNHIPLKPYTDCYCRMEHMTIPRSATKANFGQLVRRSMFHSVELKALQTGTHAQDQLDWSTFLIAPTARPYTLPVPLVDSLLCVAARWFDPAAMSSNSLSNSLWHERLERPLREDRWWGNWTLRDHGLCGVESDAQLPSSGTGDDIELEMWKKLRGLYPGRDFVEGRNAHPVFSHILFEESKEAEALCSTATERVRSETGPASHEGSATVPEDIPGLSVHISDTARIAAECDRTLAGHVVLRKKEECCIALLSLARSAWGNKGWYLLHKVISPTQRNWYFHLILASMQRQAFLCMMQNKSKTHLLPWFLERDWCTPEKVMLHLQHVLWLCVLDARKAFRALTTALLPELLALVSASDGYFARVDLYEHSQFGLRIIDQDAESGSTYLEYNEGASLSELFSRAGPLSSIFKCRVLGFELQPALAFVMSITAIARKELEGKTLKSMDICSTAGNVSTDSEEQDENGCPNIIQCSVETAPSTVHRNLMFSTVDGHRYVEWSDASHPTLLSSDFAGLPVERLLQQYRMAAWPTAFTLQATPFRERSSEDTSAPSLPVKRRTLMFLPYVGAPLSAYQSKVKSCFLGLLRGAYKDCISLSKPALGVTSASAMEPRTSGRKRKRVGIPAVECVGEEHNLDGRKRRTGGAVSEKNASSLPKTAQSWFSLMTEGVPESDSILPLHLPAIPTLFVYHTMPIESLTPLWINAMNVALVMSLSALTSEQNPTTSRDHIVQEGLSIVRRRGMDKCAVREWFIPVKANRAFIEQASKCLPFPVIPQRKQRPDLFKEIGINWLALHSFGHEVFKQDIPAIARQNTEFRSYSLTSTPHAVLLNAACQIISSLLVEYADFAPNAITWNPGQSRPRVEFGFNSLQSPDPVLSQNLERVHTHAIDAYRRSVRTVLSDIPADGTRAPSSFSERGRIADDIYKRLLVHASSRRGIVSDVLLNGTLAIICPNSNSSVEDNTIKESVPSSIENRRGQLARFLNLWILVLSDLIDLTGGDSATSQQDRNLASIFDTLHAWSIPEYLRRLAGNHRIATHNREDVLDVSNGDKYATPALAAHCAYFLHRYESVMTQTRSCAVLPPGLLWCGNLSQPVKVKKILSAIVKEVGSIPVNVGRSQILKRPMDSPSKSLFGHGDFHMVVAGLQASLEEAIRHLPLNLNGADSRFASRGLGKGATLLELSPAISRFGIAYAEGSSASNLTGMLIELRVPAPAAVIRGVIHTAFVLPPKAGMSDKETQWVFMADGVSSVAPLMDVERRVLTNLSFSRMMDTALESPAFVEYGKSLIGKIILVNPRECFGVWPGDLRGSPIERTTDGRVIGSIAGTGESSASTKGRAEVKKSEFVSGAETVLGPGESTLKDFPLLADDTENVEVDSRNSMQAENRPLLPDVAYCTVFARAIVTGFYEDCGVHRVRYLDNGYTEFLFLPLTDYRVPAGEDLDDCLDRNLAFASARQRSGKDENARPNVSQPQASPHPVANVQAREVHETPAGEDDEIPFHPGDDVRTRLLNAIGSPQHPIRQDTAEILRIIDSVVPEIRRIREESFLLAETPENKGAGTSCVKTARQSLNSHSESSSWQCQLCTYINSCDEGSCSMCGTKSPARKERKKSYWDFPSSSFRCTNEVCGASYSLICQRDGEVQARRSCPHCRANLPVMARSLARQIAVAFDRAILTKRHRRSRAIIKPVHASFSDDPYVCYEDEEEILFANELQAFSVHGDNYSHDEDSEEYKESFSSNEDSCDSHDESMDEEKEHRNSEVSPPVYTAVASPAVEVAVSTTQPASATSSAVYNQHLPRPSMTSAETKSALISLAHDIDVLCTDIASVGPLLAAIQGSDAISHTILHAVLDYICGTLLEERLSGSSTLLGTFAPAPSPKQSLPLFSFIFYGLSVLAQHFIVLSYSSRHKRADSVVVIEALDAAQKPLPMNALWALEAAQRTGKSNEEALATAGLVLARNRKSRVGQADKIIVRTSDDLELLIGGRYDVKHSSGHWREGFVCAFGSFSRFSGVTHALIRFAPSEDVWIFLGPVQWKSECNAVTFETCIRQLHTLRRNWRKQLWETVQMQSSSLNEGRGHHVTRQHALLELYQGQKWIPAVAFRPPNVSSSDQTPAACPVPSDSTMSVPCGPKHVEEIEVFVGFTLEELFGETGEPLIRKYSKRLPLCSVQLAPFGTHVRGSLIATDLIRLGYAADEVSDLIAEWNRQSKTPDFIPRITSGYLEQSSGSKISQQNRSIDANYVFPVPEPPTVPGFPDDVLTKLLGDPSLLGSYSLQSLLQSLPHFANCFADAPWLSERAAAFLLQFAMFERHPREYAWYVALYMMLYDVVPHAFSDYNKKSWMLHTHGQYSSKHAHTSSSGGQRALGASIHALTTNALEDHSSWFINRPCVGPYRGLTENLTALRESRWTSLSTPIARLRFRARMCPRYIPTCPAISSKLDESFATFIKRLAYHRLRELQHFEEQFPRTRNLLSSLLFAWKAYTNPTDMSSLSGGPELMSEFPSAPPSSGLEGCVLLIEPYLDLSPSSASQPEWSSPWADHRLPSSATKAVQDLQDLHDLLDQLLDRDNTQLVQSLLGLPDHLRTSECDTKSMIKQLFFSEEFIYALELQLADTLAIASGDIPEWITGLMKDAGHILLPHRLRRQWLLATAAGGSSQIGVQNHYVTMCSAALSASRPDERNNLVASEHPESIVQAARISLNKHGQGRSHLKYRMGAKAVVDRLQLLHDAEAVFTGLADTPARPLQVSISFKGERGIGAGVTVDFFGRVAVALQTVLPVGDEVDTEGLWHPAMGVDVREVIAMSSPDADNSASIGSGFVVPTPEMGLFPRPFMSKDRRIQARVYSIFRFIGIMLGRALQDGHLFPLQLSPLFFDILRVSVQDTDKGDFAPFPFRVRDSEAIAYGSFLLRIIKDTLLRKILHAYYPHMQKLWELAVLRARIRSQESPPTANTCPPPTEHEPVPMDTDASSETNETRLSCYASAEQEVEDMDLYFCEPFLTPLLPREQLPSDISALTEDSSVTYEHVDEFVARFMVFIAYRGVVGQIRGFMSGLRAMGVHGSMLSLLSGLELRNMLCGIPEIHWDVATLMGHVELNGYESNSPVIRNLFQELVRMSMEERADFLRFATGRPSLPPGGLANLRPKLTFCKRQVLSRANSNWRAMHINDSGHITMLRALSDSSANVDGGTVVAIRDEDLDRVSASTCFHKIHLPSYSSAVVLRARLQESIRGSAGFMDLT